MTSKINSKLILGTAQFGKPYGLNNIKKRRVPKYLIKKILNYCYNNNIVHLDTAIEYDFDLKLLKKNKKWVIDTKIIIENNRYFLAKTIKKINYIKKFKNIKINTIYIHNPQKIFSKNGLLLLKLLNKIKKSKLIKNIGISVYDVKNMLQILKKIKIDVVQLPYNILDRRFEKTFNLLKKKRIKIYARSIFLQGLIVSKLKNKLTNSKEIKKINDFSLKNKISKLKLCLSFVKKNNFLNKIIIGTDNLEQLKEILKVKKYLRSLSFQNLKSSNLNIIDPRRW